MAKEYIHCCLFPQRSLSWCFPLPRKKAAETPRPDSRCFSTERYSTPKPPLSAIFIWHESILSIWSGKNLRTEASRVTPSCTFTQARSTDVSRKEISLSRANDCAEPKSQAADLPPNIQSPETFLDWLNCKCWSLKFGTQERNKWNEKLRPDSVFSPRTSKVTLIWIIRYPQPRFESTTMHLLPLYNSIP
jgi:hypothetical protein